MSSTARWIIAIASGMFGFASIYVYFAVPGESGSKTSLFLVISFYCFAITAVCFPGPLRSVAARLIAASVVALCVAYLVSQIGKPLPTIANYKRSDNNPINALLASIIFGLPAAYVLIKGKFPDLAGLEPAEKELETTDETPAHLP